MADNVQPGDVDLWSFETGLEGGELPCKNIEQLHFYIASPSTKRVVISQCTTTGTPRATIKVLGPRAEDDVDLFTQYELKLDESKTYDRERRIDMQDLIMRIAKNPPWQIFTVLQVPSKTKR